ncbi:MAG: hypothetical protein J6A16_08990 [Oscillospiraceae bacterium]|nr:hypothetical protein [Oscillospiraceae bacterium]
MTLTEKARQFIYRNARPVDLARFRFHFEGGSVGDVLTALSFYQNEDGGFGHALEADCFNPMSLPIQTWQATEILSEIGFTDSSHPIMQGILRYLDSGKDLDAQRGQWLNTVPSNNDCPHAIWWEHKGAGEAGYNPTAALAGFIVRFAEKDAPLYKRGCEIAAQAIRWFTESAPFEEMHITGCFISLYEYLCRADVQLTDMELFREKLKAQVDLNICRDTDKWGKEYVPLPSDFILDRDSIFYSGNEELVSAECELIAEQQLADGSFTVPWEWWTDYREFTLAENWWRSTLIIKKLRFLKGMGAEI